MCRDFNYTHWVFILSSCGLQVHVIMTQISPCMCLGVALRVAAMLPSMTYGDLTSTARSGSALWPQVTISQAGKNNTNQRLYPRLQLFWKQVASYVRGAVWGQFPWKVELALWEKACRKWSEIEKRKSQQHLGENVTGSDFQSGELGSRQAMIFRYIWVVSYSLV